MMRALRPMVARGPQLRPQSDNEDQKGGGLKASQPGHGAGLDGGAGAQKGAQSHQSQIDREVQKGAGQLLQRGSTLFQKMEGAARPRAQ